MSRNTVFPKHNLSAIGYYLYILNPYFTKDFGNLKSIVKTATCYIPVHYPYPTPSKNNPSAGTLHAWGNKV